MATERLPMRHIREILRLKWGLKPSRRETARSLGIGAGAVASVLSRAGKTGADVAGARRADRRYPRATASVVHTDAVPRVWGF